jgi:two-component system sensor histidine kinase/response regulator
MKPEKSREDAIKILIAEDSPTQAEQLRHLLEEHGYTVVTAPDGKQALTAARQRKPTLVISDVMMPELDGYGLCKALKSDDELKDVPIILVTSLSDPHDVIRGLECGADNFVLKPYDERYLLSCVQFVLINREMRHAEQGSMGVEIFFNGQKHLITADRLQILNLLLSTYDAAIQRNNELKRSQEKLELLNAKLEDANQAKDNFLASMSHELRTPLNAIIGFTGTLLMRLPGPLTADQEKQLKTVQSSARHQLALINDLLDIAKIGAGKIELKSEAVVCRDVTEEVIASMRLLAEAKGLKLTASVAEAALTVRADRRALIQILLNLTGNAIKFTEQGTVSLTVKPRQEDGANFIEFSVADTGVGIRPEDKSRLFGAFEQVGIADARHHEGSGLGLHLSRKLAGLLGGRIEFTSEHGNGSTFTLTLSAELRRGAPSAG